jgi:hypothetical protein
LLALDQPAIRVPTMPTAETGEDEEDTGVDVRGDHAGDSGMTASATR